ncbi:nitroreductase [Rhodoferax sp.]|uniref:nitroreductase family protein n=1 Tax=Rhodoferax sp. TaxID=50421 RepID=UPI0025EB7C3B|nr:nitroreductase [Rhodoferax sp.]
MAIGKHPQSDPAARIDPASDGDLARALQAAESEFQTSILQPGTGLGGLTSQGAQVLAWAETALLEVEALHRNLQTSKKEAAVAPLLKRRSVSPKRLSTPGPSAEDIHWILKAALHAPDHGHLHPWRVIEFRAAQRAGLADTFEQEKRRRDPLASPEDIRRAREHATRAPVLLAFVVSPNARSMVPMREQTLSAGAALGNLLNAAHQLGFGAIVLSGERCFDPVLLEALGIQPGEFLAGFISLGSVVKAPPDRDHAAPLEVWSCWTPAAEQAAAGAPSADRGQLAD